MFKTIKSKISIIYEILVYTIAIIGICSIISIYTISQSIDGFIDNNYNSIKAAANMIEVLEKQNSSIIKYLNYNSEDNIKSFYNYSKDFNTWLEIEIESISENYESNHVDNIKKYRDDIMMEFSFVQNINSNKGKNEAFEYYNSNIIPLITNMETELRNIWRINEASMLGSEKQVSKSARQYSIIIFFLSTIAVIGGYIISKYSTNRTLRPIYSLMNNIKLVKEGSLSHQAPVISQDEIGDLTKEFNSMTVRLEKFETSTMGKLYTEKNKSMAIVRSISEPLIVLDNSYKIILINKACEDLFKIEQSNIIGKYFLEYIKNGSIFDFIYNSFNENSDVPKEKIFYMDLDGDDYYFNVVVSTIKDFDTNINGIIVIFQNVTTLKQLENMKSNLISTISHEFKTPLTSILMGTSLLKNEKIGLLNDKQLKIINTIGEDGEQLSELITDLLRLSKIESKNSIFNISSFSLNDFIKNSIKLFSEQATSKGVLINYKEDETLPMVAIDVEKTPWVINNLMSNALKFTRSGDFIKLSVIIQDDMACISVSDTGFGIPEEYQDKIFDKFMQVQNSENEIRGTGLGLTIAKEMVEALGGEIWCTSTLGYGSTFTFSLPISKNIN